MPVVVVRPAPDPREWSLSEYESTDDGRERLTYERTIDDETEERVDVRENGLRAAHVLARRTRDEMIYDALFIHAVNAN